MRKPYDHAVRAALLAQAGGDPRKEEEKELLLSPRAGTRSPRSLRCAALERRRRLSDKSLLQEKTTDRKPALAVCPS